MSEKEFKAIVDRVFETWRERDADKEIARCKWWQFKKKKAIKCLKDHGEMPEIIFVAFCYEYNLALTLADIHCLLVREFYKALVKKEAEKDERL